MESSTVNNNTKYNTHYQASGNGSKTSSPPSFFRRTVHTVGCITVFVTGIIFFPVVSISNAISEYRRCRRENNWAITMSASRAVKAFLLPIPIIGGMINLTEAIAHKVKPQSWLAHNRLAYVPAILLSVPFFGSGCTALTLFNSQVISEME